VTALLLSRRLGVVLLLSVLFAVLATLVGVLVSVSPQFDVPTSPAIVGAAAAIFVSAWLLKTGANAFRKAS
jgi:ABC-type Mn2+/Zn2+ transport system permease subunit